VASLTTSRSAPGGRESTLVQGDPLVPRLLLGRRLRDLREARGMTRADAGRSVRASVSKITRIELGRTGLRARDLVALLAAYGVRDEAEYSTLIALAEQSFARPWWQPHRDVVPDRMGAYLSAEQVARLVRRFEVEHVPELLQTEAYARELLRRTLPGPVVERRLDLLTQRQRILRRRPRPVNLWVVLDATALRNPVGDALTMRAQLLHLITMCWRPNVTVQIAPHHVRESVGADGPLTLFRFPQQGLPDMVHLDRPHRPAYPTRRAEIEHHWHIFNTLVTEASPPEQSPYIIEDFLA
jgi:transcriptional regulator with XRE-family HTH domain